MKSVIHISRGVLINVLPKQTEGVKIYFVIYLNQTPAYVHVYVKLSAVINFASFVLTQPTFSQRDNPISELPFIHEYIKRINENKTLQKCTFLMKVKNNIINAK
jgi:hypothetical protein